MSRYRRLWHPGGTYFFTHTVLWRSTDLLIRHVDILRSAVIGVRAAHPFVILAWVVLPYHFHCVMRLPEGDSRFDLRWRLIKQHFSKRIPPLEPLSEARRSRGERGLWQRRYWEHLIRDERDLEAHIDYVHINPVKHGFAPTVTSWPHSTFHRLVRAGVYPPDWAGSSAADQLSYRN